MRRLKPVILKKSLSWHSWLAWVGGIAIIIFALSGICHPLMAWTGPKASAFFPPQAKIAAEHTKAIPDILQRHDIQKALMIKVVPSEIGPVLQVTQDNTLPRRYFDVGTKAELPDFDQSHAIWLARYYTGFKANETKVSQVEFLTDFDSSYSWVNRLLPVYRIEFDSPDKRVAYIYTELNALATLNNYWKAQIQKVFSGLHTWSWLNTLESARIIIVSLLVLSIFAMAMTGTAMIFLMHARRKMTTKRQWHRYIAYIVWLPLLAFSTSGFYHLLQYSYGENHRGSQLGEPTSFSPALFNDNLNWLEQYSNVLLNGVSVIKGPQENLLYRLSIPQGKPGQAIETNKRFDGTPIEKPALYYDTLSGKASEISDRDMALYYAKHYIAEFYPELHSNHRDEQAHQQQVTGTHLVTHFGPLYDFRNKRLPVWRVDFKSELGDKLFIDPATGMLVDRLVNLQRYEGLSFSILHKWNFLSHLTSRKFRDVVMVICLSLSVILSVLGFMMLLKKKKPRST